MRKLAGVEVIDATGRDADEIAAEVDALAGRASASAAQPARSERAADR